MTICFCLLSYIVYDKIKFESYSECLQANDFLSIYFYHLPFLDRVFTIPEVKNDFLS